MTEYCLLNITSFPIEVKTFLSSDFVIIMEIGIIGTILHICDWTYRKVWDALTGDVLHSFEHKHIVRACSFSEVISYITFFIHFLLMCIWFHVLRNDWGIIIKTWRIFFDINSNNLKIISWLPSTFYSLLKPNNLSCGIQLPSLSKP